MIDTEALRKKVLDLAIRGKLTQQLPEDGTAEELLEQIQKEKQALIKEGKIKKEKPLPLITEDEIPFEVPKNWKWVRWGSLSNQIQYGYNAPAKSIGRIKMVRISDIQQNKVNWNTVPFCDISEDNIETYRLQINDILFARTGGTVGKSYLVEELEQEAVFAGYLIRSNYSSFLSAKYFKFFMETGLYWKQLQIGTTAVAQPNCNGQTLSKMIVPLPPLAEQKRIVEKIESLFSVLDKIDLLQSEYRNNLSVLKTKIIEAGIQGKLTEQLPEDGTAEELYEQIQKEKQDLIKEGKIKKEKPLPPITEDEVPFAVPDNWKWVRLADITTKIASGNTPAGGKKSSVYKENGYCFFREQNVHNDGIHYEGMVYISEELLNTRPNSTVLPKDILLNITGGSIGRASLIPETFYKGSINQHILIIRMVNYDVRYYIHHLLRSAYGQKYIKQKAVGDKEGFSGGRCKNMPIPLPPLAEQKRIVAKLDEVLAILDGKQAE